VNIEHPYPPQGILGRGLVDKTVRRPFSVLPAKVLVLNNHALRSGSGCGLTRAGGTSAVRSRSRQHETGARHRRDSARLLRNCALPLIGECPTVFAVPADRDVQGLCSIDVRLAWFDKSRQQGCLDSAPQAPLAGRNRANLPRRSPHSEPSCLFRNTEPPSADEPTGPRVERFLPFSRMQERCRMQ